MSGARGHGYTLVTPANHYPSRLPELGDQPVVKLVTPRLAPSRIGQYLIALAPEDPDGQEGLALTLLAAKRDPEAS